MRVHLLPSPAASRHSLPEGEGPRENVSAWIHIAALRNGNCERRAAHVPRRGAQVHAVRLRNLYAAAEGENVAPVNRHRSPELVEIQVSPDLEEVLVQLVQCGAARGRQGI